MVKLLLRELRVNVQTEIGEFRAELSFPTGLVVIRAENSAGKSTLVQSIIYALGLEGMLSASRDVPLPHAMTHAIDAEDGTQHPVTSSEVQLEFENHNGITVTVIRRVKGAPNHNLITLIHGPAISASGPETPYLIEDKYVRDGGAATTEAGFHHWLASFLGWNLPTVMKFDGKDCPLYLECMFPLMLVEQKKAWTGIQARMPTQFRIRDIAKRSTEFVLNFSVFEVIAKKQQLRDERERISREWHRRCIEVSTAARHAGGIINGLADEPMEKWAEGEQIALMLHRQNNWIGAAEAREQDEKDIDHLVAKEIPVVSAVSDELSQQLRSAETELANLHVAISILVQEISSKRSQLAGLSARLDELNDDLEGNKSVRKLRNMGSKVAIKSVHERNCPTCHQAVDDSLLPQNKAEEVMSLDDSIVFIETQQKMYQAARDGVTRALAVQEAELLTLQQGENDVRARIRAHKTSLVTEGHAPSRAAIEALLASQSRLARTKDAQESVESAFTELKALSLQWARVNREFKKLPDDYLSNDDQKKLKELERLFQEHATAFNVTSIAPSKITLSKDNYKPEHEGFDLDFDLSASDLIRTIWAYLHSLLELSRIENTNHLGLLVLDEPRQQETAHESFAMFFQRAATAQQFGQQVVVATSEKSDELKRILTGVNHTLIEFTGEHVLTRAVPATTDEEAVDTISPEAPPEDTGDDEMPF